MTELHRHGDRYYLVDTDALRIADAHIARHGPTTTTNRRRVMLGILELTPNAPVDLIAGTVAYQRAEVADAVADLALALSESGRRLQLQAAALGRHVRDAFRSTGV